MFKNQTEWNNFVTSEIEATLPILTAKNLTLASEQPHVAGERYLMSGKKVVLVATDTNDTPLIIKSSTDPAGVQEIKMEQKARQTLINLPFAYQPLLAPKELWSETIGSRLIVAVEFIDQPEPFLQLPLAKQFSLILCAFSMLESAHVATASHHALVRSVFPVWSATNYLQKLQHFIDVFSKSNTTEAHRSTLQEAKQNLTQNQADIERYTGFLTHEDFVLHNFRLHEGKIFLIDQASLRFGNKHESWARFMNYCLLYNRPLEQVLVRYMADNRAPEEARSLRLMRVYKSVQLLQYHAGAVTHSTGNVQALSRLRVDFWHYVLRQLLSNETITDQKIDDYKKGRDRLRSDEEKQRQVAIQQLV